jgi:FtsZ-binding cell division protein ZapB
MIDRDKLLNSLNACRHEPGYDCKKDCIFYEIGSAECIEMLMDAMHEYIGDLEDARKERDQLEIDLTMLSMESAANHEIESTLCGELAEVEKERDRLAEENQNLRKKVPKWKHVEDEKPPYNTEVKVFTAEGREYIAVYTYSKEWITEYFFDLTNKVTHWMHLDEAPTAGASPRPTENGEDENEKIRKR